MCIKGEEAQMLQVIAEVARLSHILHFEATSATLEDAFFEVLGGRGETAP
jgi:hypothetical protein